MLSRHELWRAVVAGALLASACTSQGAGPVRPGGFTTFDERPCPEESLLDWDTFGHPFVLSWCTGCHSTELPEDLRAEAPLEINLNTFEGVTAELELVWGVAADGADAMPPGGGPGVDERALLGEWLACERDRLATD